jgi:hypothetical protein
MIAQQAKSEIRNLIVKANAALHRSDIGDLRDMLNGAIRRVNALKLRDMERGSSLSLLLTGEEKPDGD